MQISEMFLARAEWWWPSTFLETHHLEGLFWDHMGTLGNRRVDNGFPVNVDPDSKMTFIEVQKLHSWIDLFMWAIEGGTLDD